LMVLLPNVPYLCPAHRVLAKVHQIVAPGRTFLELIIPWFLEGFDS
jgi:hypothetical protein